MQVLLSMGVMAVVIGVLLRMRIRRCRQMQRAGIGSHPWAIATSAASAAGPAAAALLLPCVHTVAAPPCAITIRVTVAAVRILLCRVQGLRRMQHASPVLMRAHLPFRLPKPLPMCPARLGTKLLPGTFSSRRSHSAGAAGRLAERGTRIRRRTTAAAASSPPASACLRRRRSTLHPAVLCLALPLALP